MTSRLGALSFDITDGLPSGQFKPFQSYSDPVLVAGLPPPSEWQLLGFGVDRHSQTVVVGNWRSPSSGTSIVVPYWFVALLAMISTVMSGVWVGRKISTARRVRTGALLGLWLRSPRHAGPLPRMRRDRLAPFFPLSLRRFSDFARENIIPVRF